MSVPVPRITPALAPLLLAACASHPAPPPPSPAAPAPPPLSRPDEPQLQDVRRLTFGGENAEAYWSWDGTQLIFQAREGTTGQACDRIYRMSPLQASGIDPAPRTPVSSGKGATTCSYFLPGDQEVIYASTHLGGDACPPRPDHSHGYVWPIYTSYDIFRANVDGTNVRRLTDAPGYDAEGTVCKKDGSIVFTSVRDGDLDLYRMKPDGSGVQRLTSTPGYDGGAFFNADCTRLVWRASRPKAGKELDEYQALLQQGLVRPTQLEIMTGELTDKGLTEIRQLTYLGAASFAPYWEPSQTRVIFASNYGSATGREFDLWAVDLQGTRLERVTSAPGFDGFPMFSPDGKWLAFSSNRTTPEGKHDTDAFVARWAGAPPVFTEGPADRILGDVAWLADPAREGRGVGTKGLEQSGDHVTERMKAIGLAPAGDGGTFHQHLPVTTGVHVEPSTAVALDGKAAPAGAFAPFGFSGSGKAAGRVALAGYGVVSKELGLDDYKGLDVKGKIVLVRRFVPAHGKGHVELDDKDRRRLGDVRFKAWLARERGATALLVVDAPDAHAAGVPEAPLPGLDVEGPPDDAGIPVVAVTRAAGEAALTKLERHARVEASVEVALARTDEDAFNVVGRLTARAADKRDGVIVVGAHYDHLGLGGHDSLEPEHRTPHLGADDNASGTATMLEIARALAEHPDKLRRDVVFVAFTGEESGDLGSTFFTKTPPAGLAMRDVVAMVNLDMVGRMRQDQLSVLGAESAPEWPGLVQPACDAAGVACTVGGDGYGPSDHMPFYAAGTPVLFFFTGAHADYHKPSDTADKVNAIGAAQVARIGQDVVLAVAAHERLTYHAAPSPPPAGDVRHSHASLGTVPDYSGAAPVPGVLLAGVRPGSAADKAGVQRGDVLVKLGDHELKSLEDFMFALDAYKPGDVVKVAVVRDGKRIETTATLQEARRR
jgi:Peptidase family M28/PDZ domain/PA domain/WD40-like Beta Propeller Repeat